jgi:hypothetical protein
MFYYTNFYLARKVEHHIIPPAFDFKFGKFCQVDRYRFKVEVIFWVAAFFVVLPYSRTILRFLNLIGPQGTVLLVLAIVVHVIARQKKELINF